MEYIFKNENIDNVEIILTKGNVDEVIVKYYNIFNPNIIDVVRKYKLVE